MLLAFWNADAGCRIHAFLQAQVSCFGKDRAERNLHQLVRSMREFLVVFLLLFVQEVLDIDWSKISQAKTNDVLPDMAFPGIAVTFRPASRGSPLAGWEKSVLDKAQGLQQLGTQGYIAVAAALALVNPNHHALTVDVLYLQPA
jgi:hypothetical protein